MLAMYGVPPICLLMGPSRRNIQLRITYQLLVFTRAELITSRSWHGVGAPSSSGRGRQHSNLTTLESISGVDVLADP